MPDLNVGGQAVIEGVMMRAKDRIATAVRIPSGEILVKTQEYRALSSRFKFLKVPILRGVVAFFEMLVIGIRTLNFSAEITIREQERADAEKAGKTYTDEKKKTSGLLLGGMAVVSVAIGIGVFFFLPLAVAGLFGIDKNAVGFNLMAGGVRLTLLILYLGALTLVKDFRRIFQYHGAEHKSIYTYEMGDDLTPEKAMTYTRFHPRCGTSFVLIVALVAMFLYAIGDSIYAIITGHPPSLLARFGLHFSMLPLVAGGSYELLKLSGKTRDNAVTRFLIAPGLWLQRITTREPMIDQVEVAIAALEAALGVGATDSKLTSKRTAVY
jgi:uncharacterized protein YqhQ